MPSTMQHLTHQVMHYAVHYATRTHCVYTMQCMHAVVHAVVHAVHLREIVFLEIGSQGDVRGGRCDTWGGTTHASVTVTPGGSAGPAWHTQRTRLQVNSRSDMLHMLAQDTRRS